jgi:D-serine deaminase-like pyridoxal phosphate-dependent protein
LNSYPEKFPEVTTVSSPALLIYPDRVQRNIARMIEIAGDLNRLRPHIKTHKSAEIIRMQMEAGIQKFKCATLAEAELLGNVESKEILLAIQPVGPDIQRYVELSKRFPLSHFSVVVDNAAVIHQLNSACASQSVHLGVFLDLNVGMNRTGIQPGIEAIARYKLLHEMEYLDIRGLHVYDGHINDKDLEVRTERVEDAYSLVKAFSIQIEKMGFSPPIIVAGGSPSFPIHAKREGVELSPGTTLLWDTKGIDNLKDMPFEPAAFLLTRIVSKPAPDLVCFDLGHKAVASEMPHPRVRLAGMEDVEFVGHSEEHLVAKTDHWHDLQVGDAYLGIPTHICPTVALFDHVSIVKDDKVVGTWKNAARHRL